MKHLTASFLLCFCLVGQSTAGNPYYNDSDWRSLPFIEMMVTMMKIMNDIMDGNKSNYYPGINTFPYSPAFMPGTGMYSGLNNFNTFPMSPGGMGNFPTNQFTANRLPDSFPTGQNASNTSSGSFWDPDTPEQQPQTTVKTSVNSNSLNGIWQALSGDVIAIYNNDRFIWSDGNAKNLAGRLAIKGNQLYAYIPASKVTIQFQFYREPGQFIVRDKNSRIYTFKRLH